jgi:Rod binding domain-containing protein
MSAPVSSSLPLSTTDLPVVSQTLEPAWVRKGSAATQKAYDTALAFEQMLVEQLSQSLTASSGLSGESGEEGESSEGGASGASAASSPISSMLPQALTSGVMNAGGLGLAAQMTRQLESAAGVTHTSASANTDAAATGGTSASTASPVEGASNTSSSATPLVSSDTGTGSNVAATGGTSA